MDQVLGWIGFALFFLGAWLLGDRRTGRRHLGLMLMSGCNVLFSVQAVMTENWSLLCLSIGAAALQLRAVLNWRKYDGN